MKLALVLLGLCACAGPRSDVASGRGATAERWFRAVYSGDTAVVDELAADDVVVSYPVFEEVLGTPALRGHDAVMEFVGRFARRWSNPRIVIHEAIVEDDRVVLVWSFCARPASAATDAGAADRDEACWGGITLVRFDALGRITAEIGEESDPGPAGRVASGGR